MATRDIAPQANNEGLIGTVAKKWAGVWATLVNGLTLAANAIGFSISGGTTSKTLTVNKSLTLDGTDSTTMTFPTTSATIARTDAAQTFTGVQTFAAPVLGTPTSGALDNCTSNTEADNNSTTQLATTAFAKSQDAVLARLPDQAVNMTAAASGSSGITVVDSDNIDFGTDNFTLVWCGSLPDWTPSGIQTLVSKYQDLGGGNYAGFELKILTTGIIRLTLLRTDAGDVYAPSVAVSIADNTNHEIIVVVIRETISTSGSVSFYCDGLLVDTATPITAGAPGTVSNTGPLYVLGGSNVRTAGTCSFAATYNRALTAAEVLDLYRNGIAFADKWGSQSTPTYTSNFGVSVQYFYTYFATIDYNIDGIGGKDDNLRCYASADNQKHGTYLGKTVGKNVRVTGEVYIANSGGTTYFDGLKVTDEYLAVGPNGPVLWETTTVGSWVSFDFISTYNTSSFMLFVGRKSGGYNSFVGANSSASDVFYVRDVKMYIIGATLALEPEGIQNDKWYDSSSNALNASYPAAGWSLTRKLIPNADQPIHQVNLLTNSGFGVWSNSVDLYDATTGAVPVVTGNDAALVAGGSLVTNGGFDSVTTGWTAGDCTIASVAGGQTNNCIQITRTGANEQSATITSDITIVVGKLYEVSAWVKSGTSGDEAFIIRDNTSPSTRYVAGTSSGTWTQYSFVMEATGTAIRISLVKNTATAGTMLFDTVTLNEVTPGIASASANGPDGWTKETTSNQKIYRQHNDGGTLTKDGSFYSLKIVESGGVARNLTWPNTAITTLASHMQKFAGRTVTFGCWVKSSSANTVRIGIGPDTTAWTSKNAGTDWEWFEVTKIVTTSPTAFYVVIEVISATTYVSQPMLVFGSSIGEGNYVQPPGEWVILEGTTRLNNGETVLSTDDKILNVEALTNGEIPKGAIALSLTGQVINSNALSGQGIKISKTSSLDPSIMIYPLVNNLYGVASGIVPCDSNGDVYQTVTAAADTLSAYYLYANAVQVSP